MTTKAYLRASAAAGVKGVGRPPLVAAADLEPAADHGVAAAQRTLAHAVAGVRRLDDAAAAGVDGDVVAVAGVAEEHEVAGPQVAERQRSALPLLIGGAMPHLDADLRVAVHGESGAVEAARAGAAPHVRDAEIALRDGDDLGMTGAVGIHRRRHDAAPRLLGGEFGGQGRLLT